MAEQVPVTFEFRADQTFGDFFPAGHREILNHLQRCVAGSGERFIYLWGDAGLGKSHLLQACCQAANQQQLTAFYCPLNNLPDPEILTGLERFDLVCADALESVAGKPEWEQALFHFFNRLQAQDTRLIVTARCAPADLGIALPDLRTRLHWGLTLKLKPLSDDDIAAALHFRAQRLGFELSPQAGRFLLTHFQRDLATLWPLLDTLDRASLAAQRKLTLPFVKKILQNP